MDVKDLWLAQVSLHRSYHCNPSKFESLSVLVLAETQEEAKEKVEKKYTMDSPFGSVDVDDVQLTRVLI